MFSKFLLVVFILLFAIFTNNATGQEIINSKPDYYSLLQKIMNFDKSVDFKAFRLSYTETPDYDPYQSYDKEKKAMYDDLRNKEYEKALKSVQSILDKNYVDIDAHNICRIAYREMKNPEKYNFHQFIVTGLIDSILNSGDGKSPETAYLVISIDEEYVILAVLDLKLIKQSLIKSNSKNYDKIEARNRKTGETTTLYFNIDIPFSRLRKK